MGLLVVPRVSLHLVWTSGFADMTELRDNNPPEILRLANRMVSELIISAEGHHEVINSHMNLITTMSPNGREERKYSTAAKRQYDDRTPITAQILHAPGVNH